MSKNSAGVLLYRKKHGVPEVFLVHPGGPYYAKRDDGVWSIPKGEIDGESGLLETAMREFEEETGNKLSGIFTTLNPVKLKSGKVVYAFAVEGNVDPSVIISNTFPLQWPPYSGKYQDFPEVDKGDWFSLKTARQKLNPGQTPLIDQLERLLNS